MTFRSPPNSEGVAGVLTQCIDIDNVSIGPFHLLISVMLSWEIYLI